MPKLNGSNTRDHLIGSSEADEISSFLGDDVIYAGAGNDRVITGDGADTVYGADGDDEINGYPLDARNKSGSYSSWNSSGPLLIFGENGDDFVVGSIAADKIYGGDGKDVVYGRDGNDFVDGGDGDDSLFGGAGDNQLFGGIGNDYLSTYGELGKNYLNGGEGNDGVYGGDGNDFLEGGAGDDKLYGYKGKDNLAGGDGQDILVGGEGDDALDGGAGDDQLYGDQGNDSLTGGDGQDQLFGADGDDTLEGGRGDDKLYGNKGKDTLAGGDGKDLLVGNEGDDALDGGAGDDQLYGDQGNDSLSGGDGQDQLAGADGDDTLDGGAGDDQLYGGQGNDSLSGGQGDDKLYGEAGNDILAGGDGKDNLFGGDGNDTYIITDRGFHINDTGGKDTAIVSVSFVKIPSTIEEIRYIEDALPIPYWISALLPESPSAFAYANDYTGSARLFRYTFPSTIPSYDTHPANSRGYKPFNETQKQNVVSFFRYLEQVINARFDETTNANQLDTLAFAMNYQEGSAGYATYPHDGPFGSDVFLKDYDSNHTLNAGTSGAHVLVHEIGHALGLKHPFARTDVDGDVADPPYLASSEDQGRWTRMSYTVSSDQYQLTFSPLDVAALQYIYGVSPTVRTGNDVYNVQATASNFLWDGNGTDTIDASLLSSRVTLFLEPGYWGFIGSRRADTITSDGQVTVNFGSVIENVVGTAFDDELHGNHVANLVAGGAGNDFLYGNEGADTLYGGTGNDFIDGGADTDYAVYTSAFSDLIISAVGTDVFVTSNSEGVDTLRSVEYIRANGVEYRLSSSLPANAATYSLSPKTTSINEGSTAQFSLITSNVKAGTTIAYAITGVSASDLQSAILTGSVIVSSTGTTTISIPITADGIAEGAEILTITAQGKSASVLINDTSTASNTVQVYATDHSGIFLANGAKRYSGTSVADSIIGTTGGDYIYGAAGDDKLFGLAGNDFVMGEGGSDYLSGDDGDDTLDGGAGDDNLYGGKGDNVLFGGAGNDFLSTSTELGRNYLNGGEGNDSLLGGDGDDILEGGSGDDKLFGNRGKDFLAGGEGKDELFGGDGADTLEGALGDDKLDGGGGIDTAVYSGSRASVVITKTVSGFTAASAQNGLDTLAGIERLKFAGSFLALDLAGNAGIVAKVLGAVAGKSSLTNKSYVGIGLDLLDNGMSYSDLGAAALQAVGLNTNDRIVTTLWTNVLGTAPTLDEKASVLAMLENGMSRGDLVKLAAETPQNLASIGLVGLVQNGIEYTPVG